MPHFPSLMNPAFNRFPTSVDAPSFVPQIAPSTSFLLSHHPSSSTTTAPVSHPPLASPLALDPPKPPAPPVLADASGAPSTPRPGPAARHASSGVITCRQWCVTSQFVFGSAFHPKSPAFHPPTHILYFPFPPGINSRSRKIRCDSTRPKCQNCLKRGKDCVFDKVRKRRGPDKRPGMRKRSCKKRQSDARADCKQNEISPVTLPVFVPAHHKANKSDPPAPNPSHVEGNSSFHDGYHVKVSFPLFPLPVSPPLYLYFSLCLHRSR